MQCARLNHKQTQSMSKAMTYFAYGVVKHQLHNYLAACNNKKMIDYSAALNNVKCVRMRTITLRLLSNKRHANKNN